MTIYLDMIQSLALATGLLFSGKFVKRRIHFFQKYCIPSPVIGGLIFSVLVFICHEFGWLYINFNTTLQDFFMIAFFTTVGYNASIKPLKQGGKHIFIFLVLIACLIICQNIIALGIGKLLNVPPLLSLCTGSIPMVGGHGSAGAFGPTIKAMGVDGATSVAIASATFGLVAGSAIGGPIAKRLIEKKNLYKEVEHRLDDPDIEDSVSGFKEFIASGFSYGFYQIVIAMGLGTLVSYVLKLTGLKFPSYIGAMLVAAAIRNYSDFTGKFKVYFMEIQEIGEASLSFFLSMALMTLELWTLSNLALPMLILLASQLILMMLFSRFVIFKYMGKDYDAAVMTAGACGFGMGATPNAMANMQSIVDKYAPSPQAFLVVPIVGALFIDFLNSLIITGFISFF